MSAGEGHCAQARVTAGGAGLSKLYSLSDLFGKKFFPNVRRSRALFLVAVAALHGENNCRVIIEGVQSMVTDVRGADFRKDFGRYFHGATKGTRLALFHAAALYALIPRRPRVHLDGIPL